MATKVRTVCDTCGPQVILPASLTLNVSERAPEMSHYTFVCACCDCVVVVHVDHREIRELTEGGASVTKNRWEPPAEALEPHTGDAFTEDDLIAFGRALQGCEALSTLARWCA